MTFRLSGSNRSDTVDTANAVSSTSETTAQQSSLAQADQSNLLESQDTAHYEVDITSRRHLNELQRLEKTHGDKVHQWIDEGIPREAMGAPRDMEAFRMRKGTPVPWNVETQNAQSVQRSSTAAADTSPAGETGVPDSVRDVLSSSGHSLEGSVQRLMEDRMGESFGDVQIHTGPSAATACEDINARAFTVGNHVAFNQGEYNPSSPEGQHTIAHELAHVRQQTSGAVSLLPQDGLDLEIDPDPQLEREAEETAQRVMAGSELGIQRLKDTAVHVQRTPHGNSQTAPGSYRDHPEVIAGRTQLLNGLGLGGMAVQGAHQQRGPSCVLAALQAGLVAKGRNTASLARLLKQYPDKLLAETDSGKIVDLLMDEGSSVDDVIQSYTADTGTRATLRTLLQQSGDDTKLKMRSDKHATESYTKGIVSLLISLFENRRTGMDKNGPIAPDRLQQINEDIQTGTNLLKLVRERGQAFGSSGDTKTLKNEAGIETLKTEFMQIVDDIETPFLVNIQAKYAPFANQIEEGSTRHMILVYGVRRDDDGTTFVELRDSNDPDGWTQELELDKFLSPLENQTIKHQLGRDPDSRDAFLINDLNMDVDLMNSVSSPIETPDETAKQQPRPALRSERDRYDQSNQHVRTAHSLAGYYLHTSWSAQNAATQALDQAKSADTGVGQAAERFRSAMTDIVPLRQQWQTNASNVSQARHQLQAAQSAANGTPEQQQANASNINQARHQLRTAKLEANEARQPLWGAALALNQVPEQQSAARSIANEARQRAYTHVQNGLQADSQFRRYSDKYRQTIKELHQVGRPVIDSQVTQALQHTRRQATSVQPIDRTRRAFLRQHEVWKQHLSSREQQYNTYVQHTSNELACATHALAVLGQEILHGLQASQRTQQSTQQTNTLSEIIHQYQELAQYVAQKQAAVDQRRTALEQEHGRARQDLAGFYASFAQARANRTTRWATEDSQSSIEKQARRQSEQFALAGRTYDQIFEQQLGDDLKQQYQQLQEASEEFSQQAEHFRAADEQAHQFKRQRIN